MSKIATDYEYRITKVSDGFISTDWLNHNLLSFTCCRDYFFIGRGKPICLVFKSFRHQVLLNQLGYVNYECMVCLLICVSYYLLLLVNSVICY